MAGGISLLLQKNGTWSDISRLTQSVTWSGRKGSAARSLSVTLLDDDRQDRAGVNVAEGNQVIFSHNGTELFRGMIMRQTQSQVKNLTFPACDSGIYLANNRDTFCYKGKTASDIFVDCCKRYGLKYGEVATTSYRIPELVKPATTPFDVIMDALSQDFKATGVRHFLQSEKGVLWLLTRRENIQQWVIEPGANLISYTYTQSIEKTKTRIALLSKENTVVASARNTALESKIGIFQNVDRPDDKLSRAQLQKLADSMLAEQGIIERILSVEALGIPSLISGFGVYVLIPHLGLAKTFYIDDDTHTFKDNMHIMRLSLSFASDFGMTSGSAGTGHKEDDIVQFKGGYHYSNSGAANPTGDKQAPGAARLTLIAKGAKHPYHLIHQDKASTVYGWVDTGTF
ncbi:MAG: hypothetical protein LBJ12_01015 [Oscillospiraceae bacterium]|jgi:hypothetical protein|nr:hypothetical protein [Oscillospiraceae bacterium]